MVKHCFGSELLTTGTAANLRQSLSDREDEVISKRVIFQITAQILDRTERLHKLGFVHSNINPSSIYHSSETKDKLVLGDFYFGLRFKLKCPDSYRKRTCFQGSAFFISTGACNLEDYCFRDDIESIFLLVVYLLRGFRLPWFNKSFSEFESTDIQKVLDARRQNNWTNELLEGLPKELKSLWARINKLGFDDVPDYQLFR